MQPARSKAREATAPSPAPDSAFRARPLVLSETWFPFGTLRFGPLPLREQHCLTWSRRAGRVYLLSTPTQGRAPLGVAPPGPRSDWAVYPTWQVPGLACRSSTAWLPDFPRHTRAFAARLKELDLVLRGETHRTAPEWTAAMSISSRTAELPLFS